MLEVNKTRTERETLAQLLKAEIRSKMEQIDTLKLSILKHEYDLYKLYSRLDDLEADGTSNRMQAKYCMSEVSEKKNESSRCVQQAG